MTHGAEAALPTIATIMKAQYASLAVKGYEHLHGLRSLRDHLVG